MCVGSILVQLISPVSPDGYTFSAVTESGTVLADQVIPKNSAFDQV